MSLRHVDRWFGLALLLLAIVWTWIVVTTLPSAEVEGEAGPRGFPLLLGLALGALGLYLSISGFLGRAEGGGDEVRVAPVTGREARIVGLTFVLLVAYAFLLDKIGFLVATPLMLVAALWLLVGEHSWVKILLITVGLTLGTYLVFGVLLQTKLPEGAWLDLF
jgi:putative tricarboxylic transport membrane protein